jgi:UDP-glucose:(heptosyl)LPS alpha-1,3-glucosyltransferase
MSSEQLKIGFVRRGFSRSGGAEAYLKRLAQGVTAAGHEVQLVTTNEWPANEWSFGTITRVAGETPLQFADELETLRPRLQCDFLMSLERVWRCNVYRAGDGVHRAWLERRARFADPIEKFTSKFNRTHPEILELEESLFRKRGAGRVIANSCMVRAEIVKFFDYPTELIDVVPNGVPADQLRPTAEKRAESRHVFGFRDQDIVVLFVGSGWKRKGLRFAIAAVEGSENPHVRLVVAGRGQQSKYRSRCVQFLGEVADVASLYAAADIFLLPTIYDPFSNACLEAIASGLPVITTRANGFSEIIADGVNGSVVGEPDDIACLTAALGHWSDAESRAEARARNFELAACYDIATNVARTLDILLAPKSSR